MHQNHKRNWTNYNDFKTHAQPHAPGLLEGIIQQTALPPRPSGPGRPVTEEQERHLLYYTALRTLLKDSSRDAIGHIPWLQKNPVQPPLPHFNTLTDFLRRPRTTILIQAALEESTRPMWDLERVFACDASGIGIPYAPRWNQIRSLTKGTRKDYVKLHMACGVSSNLVVAAHVTNGRRNDSPIFPLLAQQVGRHFLVEEISADNAYCSRENCRIVDDLGGVPYFWPKKEFSPRSLGVVAWRRMIKLFQEYPSEFRASYHQRSNSETVFAVLKALFGGSVLAKSPVARFNEVLLKVLCYNVVVLVRSAMEMGVDLSMVESAGSPDPAYPLAPRGEWVGVGWAPGGCQPVELP